MKRILLCTAILVGGLLFSCKKIVQQQEQNALVSMITSGTWKVTRYIENGSDITAAFSNYAFKFNSNNTVECITLDSVSEGTWTGNLSARTISANFPAAGVPINLLNAVWTITDSYPDSVAAQTTINNSTNILNMHN